MNGIGSIISASDGTDRDRVAGLTRTGIPRNREPKFEPDRSTATDWSVWGFRSVHKTDVLYSSYAGVLIAQAV